MSLIAGTLSWAGHVSRVRTLYRRSLKLNFQYAFTRYARALSNPLGHRPGRGFLSDPCPRRDAMPSQPQPVTALCSLHRDVFNRLCTDTRHQFEAHKNMKDFGEIETKVAEMQSKLFAHPEPYILGWDRGGTAFMRNPPPGFEVLYPS